MQDYVFKTQSNTVICINLTKETARKINKIRDENIRKLHIFVIDPENVDVSALRAFAKTAVTHRETRVIMHCANKADARRLKSEVKDIEKNKWFHVSWKSAKREFRIKASEEKAICVMYIGETLLRVTYCSKDKKQPDYVVLCGRTQD